MTVDEIVNEALELNAEARAEFLEDACGHDPNLRRDVDELLDAIENVEEKGFLASGFMAGQMSEGESNEDLPADWSAADSGRFEVLGQHATGGLGEVWVARDRQLNRKVALKQIQRQWANQSNAAERFRQEAEITGYLEHPGVVPVYAMGQREDGRPFYAMQFIRGKTMGEAVREILQGERWYSTGELRELLDRLIDVCQTIEYAHSKDIVHRDLKPANIMLGAYGQTLVVDWGLAKFIGPAVDPGDDDPRSKPMGVDHSNDQSGSGAADETWSAPSTDIDQTRQGTALGTPRFMSPEQAVGEVDSMGRATDVYGLGATLYYLLTGQAPHNDADSNVTDLLATIASGELVEPRKVQPEIPKSLEAITLKAMSREPGNRYDSPAGLADDLKRYLADESVSVLQDPLFDRVLRWTRRHRAIAASAFVALVLSMTGIIVGILVYDEMRRREMAAENQRQNDRDAKLLESEKSASAAQVRAAVALAQNRYADAAALLGVALDRMGDEPTLQEQAAQVKKQYDRLSQIGRFYEFSQSGQDMGFLGRSVEAAILQQQALKELGVWESTTWWADLPDADLTAAQRDRLRWDIYHDLIDLASMYVTRMTVKLGGKTDSGTPSSFRLMRNFLRTNAGVPEARAAVVLCNRIESFRPAQATRWLRGIAEFRLRQSSRTAAHELGPPENVSDGYALSEYALIASVDPQYRAWFGGYGDTFLDLPRSDSSDPENGDRSTLSSVASRRELIVALETLRRVSDLGSENYWIRLSIGQTQYLFAQQAAASGDYDVARNHYELARTEYGRCVALRPDAPFGYADRSTVALRQADLMRNHPDAPQSDRRHAADLLRQSLRDANQAARMKPLTDWVHWHVGATNAYLNQIEEAYDAFFRAVQLGFDMTGSMNIPLVRLDDVRGRTDAFRFAESEVEKVLDERETGSRVDEQRTKAFTLMAALHLSRTQYDQSWQWALRAIQASGSQPAQYLLLAHQVAGWSALRSGRDDDARDHFAAARKLAPDSIWSLVGSAQCERGPESYRQSRQWLSDAIETTRVPRHLGAAWLGIAELEMLSGNVDKARSAIEYARQVDPACDLSGLTSVVKQEARRLIKQAKSADTELKKSSATEKLETLKPLATAISRMPMASVNQILDAATDKTPSELPLLDGGFELPMDRYWQSDTAMVWQPSHSSAGSAPVRRNHDSAGTGDWGLAIRGSSQPGSLSGDKSTWWTGQSVPVTSGETYRIAAMVRCPKPAMGALEFRVTDGNKTLCKTSLQDVRPSWSEFEVTFSVPEQTDGIGLLRFEIHVHDHFEGRIDVDDIKITLVAGESAD